MLTFFSRIIQSIRSNSSLTRRKDPNKQCFVNKCKYVYLDIFYNILTFGIFLSYKSIATHISSSIFITQRKIILTINVFTNFRSSIIFINLIHIFRISHIMYQI